MPVDVPWRRRWPFFIQWDDPEEERVCAEGVDAHPNGASAATGVAVGDSAAEVLARVAIGPEDVGEGQLRVPAEDALGARLMLAGPPP